MAKSKVSGGLVSKLGMKARQAVEAHKNDETVISGGGDLPAGIELGIAQLATCKFGVYEKGDMKGEYFFMASGIVISPKKHEGIPVQGLRTTIGPEPICETPNRSRKTVEDHIAWVLNEMRKLGVDTSELTADDLETTAQALQETKPHFRFRTWAGEPTKEYPNPRTNHQWSGVVDYEEAEEEAEDEVVDNTEEEEAAEEEVEEEVEETEEEEASEEAEEEVDYLELGRQADKKDTDAEAQLAEKALEVGIEQDDIDSAKNWVAVAKMVIAAIEASGEEEEAGEEEAEDLDALGAAADESDGDAIDRLTQLAEENGLDPNDGESYPDWATLATAIGEAQGVEGEVEEEAEEEEAAEPAVGEVWYYKPKGAKKAVECEVTLVGKTTVNLKNLDDGKTVYKGVPFDQISAS